MAGLVFDSFERGPADPTYCKKHRIEIVRCPFSWAPRRNAASHPAPSQRPKRTTVWSTWVPVTHADITNMGTPFTSSVVKFLDALTGHSRLGRAQFACLLAITIR